MKQLRVTEIDALAREASMRVQKVLDEHNDRIKKSSGYINFEDSFRRTTVGVLAFEVKTKAQRLDSIIESEFPEDKHNYHSSSRWNCDSSYDKLLNKYKNIAYPMLTAQDLTDDLSNTRSYHTHSLIDFFSHQITIAQLTRDDDIKEILNGLVQDILNKIPNAS